MNGIKVFLLFLATLHSLVRSDVIDHGESLISYDLTTESIIGLGSHHTFQAMVFNQLKEGHRKFFKSNPAYNQSVFAEIDTINDPQSFTQFWIRLGGQGGDFNTDGIIINCLHNQNLCHPYGATRCLQMGVADPVGGPGIYGCIGHSCCFPWPVVDLGFGGCTLSLNIFQTLECVNRFISGVGVAFFDSIKPMSQCLASGFNVMGQELQLAFQNPKLLADKKFQQLKPLFDGAPKFFDDFMDIVNADQLDLNRVVQLVDREIAVVAHVDPTLGCMYDVSNRPGGPVALLQPLVKRIEDLIIPVINNLWNNQIEPKLFDFLGKALVKIITFFLGSETDVKAVVNDIMISEYFSDEELATCSTEIDKITQAIIHGDANQLTTISQQLPNNLPTHFDAVTFLVKVVIRVTTDKGHEWIKSNEPGNLVELFKGGGLIKALPGFQFIVDQFLKLLDIAVDFIINLVEGLCGLIPEVGGLICNLVTDGLDIAYTAAVRPTIMSAVTLIASTGWDLGTKALGDILIKGAQTLDHDPKFQQNKLAIFFTKLEKNILKALAPDTTKRALALIDLNKELGALAITLSHTTITPPSGSYTPPQGSLPNVPTPPSNVCPPSSPSSLSYTCANSLWHKAGCTVDISHELFSKYQHVGSVNDILHDMSQYNQLQDYDHLNACKGLSEPPCPPSLPSGLSYECANKLWHKFGCKTDISQGLYNYLKTTKGSILAVEEDMRAYYTLKDPSHLATCQGQDAITPAPIVSPGLALSQCIAIRDHCHMTPYVTWGRCTWEGLTALQRQQWGDNRCDSVLTAPATEICHKIQDYCGMTVGVTWGRCAPSSTDQLLVAQFTRLNCDHILVAPLVSQFSLPPTSTYNDAVSICRSHGKQLIKYSQLCPTGDNTQPFLKKNTDTWIPIRDRFNDWVEVGDNRLCWSHIKHYGPAPWGLERRNLPFRNVVLCTP